MKPWITLIAGVVLIITPQVIVGVIAANSAWVQSSHLYALGAIESGGQVASDRVALEALPAMPNWMMPTSTIVGVLLCLMCGVQVLRDKAECPALARRAKQDVAQPESKI